MEAPFDIEILDDHVRVILRGGTAIAPGYEEVYWRAIREACEKGDTHRILIEGTPPKVEPRTEEIVEAGLRTGVVPKLWIAYCLDGFAPTPESELYEAVARTRGVRVKFFSNRDTALNWLRHNSPK